MSLNHSLNADDFRFHHVSSWELLFRPHAAAVWYDVHATRRNRTSQPVGSDRRRESQRQRGAMLAAPSSGVSGVEAFLTSS